MFDFFRKRDDMESMHLLFQFFLVFLLLLFRQLGMKLQQSCLQRLEGGHLVTKMFCPDIEICSRK